jgi:hypothetical protein
MNETNNSFTTENEQFRFSLWYGIRLSSAPIHCKSRSTTTCTFSFRWKLRSSSVFSDRTPRWGSFAASVFHQDLRKAWWEKLSHMAATGWAVYQCSQSHRLCDLCACSTAISGRCSSSHRYCESGVHEMAKSRSNASLVAPIDFNRWNPLSCAWLCSRSW